MIRLGTLDVVSSDHSGWGYMSPVGKRVHGTNAPFSDIPNGVPGVGSRASGGRHESRPAVADTGPA